MRVSYDQKLDTLFVRLNDTPIARTVEVGAGLLDLSESGDIVAFELLGASGVIEQVAELAKKPNLEDALASRLRTYVADAQEQIHHPA